jgi:hypothetical protein
MNEPKRKSLWWCLGRAFTLTAVLYLFIELTALFVGDPATPLLKRFPLAWILYWPKQFSPPSTTITGNEVVVCVFLNIAVYTGAIYAVAWLWNRKISEHSHR